MANCRYEPLNSADGAVLYHQSISAAKSGKEHFAEPGERKSAPQRCSRGGRS
jgi:hypothetical protein